MKWVVIIFTMCTQAVLAQNIVRLEYFIDTDPGYGMGQSMTISANTTTLDILSEIDLNEITTGVHTLYFRIKDENNVWSHTNSRVFLKEATSVANTSVSVSDVEYFLDEDPGHGSGIPLSVASNSQIDHETSLDISEIANGVHTIYFRVRDSSGSWGLAHSKSFVKAQVGNPPSRPQFVSGEYFFDADPGPGNGLPLTVSESEALDFTTPIGLSEVGNGVHTFNIRLRDNFSNWGFVHSRPFVRQLNTQREPLPAISSVEYYFNSDPGVGNRRSLSFEQKAAIDVMGSLDLSGNATGTHTLFLKSTNENGAPSFVHTQDIFIDDCVFPTPGFATEPTCFGEMLTFEDLSSGVDANTIYAWDFGNDDSIDSNQNGSLLHLFQQQGVLEVELKVQNGTLCKDSIVHEVNILPLPDIDAGSDVEICLGDSIMLGAIATGSFSWDPTAGLSKTDINNPFAKPESSTEYALTVTADNGCSNTDQVMVTVYDTYKLDTGAQICEGDSIMLEGSYQKISGVYMDTLQSTFGCDSIINTTLTVHELPTVSLGNDFTLCGNCEETLDAGAGFEEYVWSNGLDIQAITVGEPGEYFVKVTDANGCSNADTVVVDQVLGIHDHFDFLGISLFPNPTDRWINLMIDNDDGLQEVRILISNILGKAVEERVIELKLGKNPVILDYKHLAKGLYNMLFISEKGEIYKKVLLE